MKFMPRSTFKTNKRRITIKIMKLHSWMLIQTILDNLKKIKKQMMILSQILMKKDLKTLKVYKMKRKTQTIRDKMINQVLNFNA